jgi:hypothetical protein
VRDVDRIVDADDADDAPRRAIARARSTDARRASDD